MDSHQSPAASEVAALRVREHPALRRSSDPHEVLKDVSEEAKAHEALSKAHAFRELAEEAAQLRHDLDEPFFLMVVGEGKFGKSTLINALVGRKVAEEGLVPKTWTVDVYRPAGKAGERAELYLAVDRETPVSKTIEGARKYCEDQRKLARESKKAAQSWKSPVFQVSWFYDLVWPNHDVAIVDTPGFLQDAFGAVAKVVNLFGAQGIEIELSEAFDHYYRRADVVLWCLKATKLDDESTQQMMSRVAGYKKKVIGLITRYDEVLPDDRDKVMESARKLYGQVISEFHFVAAGAKDTKLRFETVESLRRLLDEEIIPHRETLKRDADEKSVTRLRADLVRKVDAITDVQVSNLLLKRKKLEEVEAIAKEMSNEIDARVLSVWRDIGVQATSRIPAFWDKAAATSNPSESFRALVDDQAFNRSKARDDLVKIQNEVYNRVSLAATKSLSDLKWHGVKIGGGGAERTSTLAVVESIECVSLGVVGTITPNLSGKEGSGIAWGVGIGAAALGAIVFGPLGLVAGLAYFAVKSFVKEKSIAEANAKMEALCQTNAARSREAIQKTVDSFVEQVTSYIERSFMRHNGGLEEQIVSRAHAADRTLNVLNAWPEERTVSRDPLGDAARPPELSTYFLSLLPALPSDAAKWDAASNAILDRIHADAKAHIEKEIQELSNWQRESIDAGNLEDPAICDVKRLKDEITPKSLQQFSGVSPRDRELMETTCFSRGETLLSRFAGVHRSLRDTCGVELDRCTRELQAHWDEKAEEVLEERLSEAITQELGSPAAEIDEADESRIRLTGSHIYQSIVAPRSVLAKVRVSGADVWARAGDLAVVLRERAPDADDVLRAAESAGVMSVHFHQPQRARGRLDDLANRVTQLPELILAGLPGFEVETGALGSASWQERAGKVCSLGALILGGLSGAPWIFEQLFNPLARGGAVPPIAAVFVVAFFASLSWLIGAHLARTRQERRVRAAVDEGVKKLAVAAIGEVRRGLSQVVSQWIAESLPVPVTPSKGARDVIDASALVPRDTRPLAATLPALAGVASFLWLAGMGAGLYTIATSTPSAISDQAEAAAQPASSPGRGSPALETPEPAPRASRSSSPPTSGIAKSAPGSTSSVVGDRAASDEHIKRGRASYKAGATAEAIAAFRMATASDQSNAQAHLWLSNALIRDSQFVEAETEARTGLLLAGNAEQRGEALHNVCRALEGQGRLDEALQSCMSSLEVRPASADAANTIERIRAAQSEATTAPAEATTAPAESGVEPGAVGDCREFIDRGLAANRSENQEEAILSFQQAVACNEENPRAHLFLSNALIVAERYAEGADAARRALVLAESGDQQGAAYNNLCRAMEGLGRIEEAVRNCEQSLLARPGDERNESIQRNLERLRDELRRASEPGPPLTKANPFE